MQLPLLSITLPGSCIGSARAASGDIVLLKAQKKRVATLGC